MISGGSSEEVVRRMNGLGVTEVIMGASEKEGQFEQLCQRWGLEPELVCYMGDDIPDIPVLKAAGLACCPNDAAPEVRGVSHYVSPVPGGEGCVRDVLEQAMKVKGLWMNDLAHAW
jgi:3-deoxy-D-manno-octulosonate 8-phosphate phosphatase (KDO 8-P phosphatase)